VAESEWSASFDFGIPYFLSQSSLTQTSIIETPLRPSLFQDRPELGPNIPGCRGMTFWCGLGRGTKSHPPADFVSATQTGSAWFLGKIVDLSAVDTGFLLSRRPASPCKCFGSMARPGRSAVIPAGFFVPEIILSIACKWYFSATPINAACFDANSDWERPK